LLIKPLPVEPDVKNEHVVGKVLDKVDEGVEGHVVQALFRQGEPVPLFWQLAAKLTTPELELIEQIVQGVVAELEGRSLLETDGVRRKRKLDG
jgi:hypothetical protein